MGHIDLISDFLESHALIFHLRSVEPGSRHYGHGHSAETLDEKMCLLEGPQGPKGYITGVLDLKKCENDEITTK